MDNIYNYAEVKWAMSREAELVHPITISKTGEYFTIHDLFSNERFYVKYYHQVNNKLKKAYGVNSLTIIGTDDYYIHKLRTNEHLSSAFQTLPNKNHPNFIEAYQKAKFQTKVTQSDLITFARQIKIIEGLEKNNQFVEVENV